MTTKDKIEWLLRIMQELTAFYASLSAELNETDSRAWLHFVKCDTRATSELKKIPKMPLPIWTLRRCNESKNFQNNFAMG